MDWSKEAVTHYKSNKKSRFQNSQYYFRQGIGVPMISSSCISASLLDNRLFDQSIVGIFLNDNTYVYYILGFFNTKTCNTLIRTINPTANNSANYIKKIPFIKPTKTVLHEVDLIVKTILKDIKTNGEYDLSFNNKLEDIFQSIYKI
jgi:hypothetical protein